MTALPQSGSPARPCLIVHVAGDIDCATADQMRAQVLIAARAITPPRVVIAFADVQACDSSGLGALVAIWKSLRANGGTVVITRPPQKCRRMLTRTGLDPTITVRESLDGAVATAIRAR